MEVKNTPNNNVTPLRQSGDNMAGDVAARIPPHNYEAEMALLGAILANNLVFDKVNEFLRPDHFADALHGRIYEAAGKLIERGQIANALTLKSLFDQDPALIEHGGAAYLARLAGSVVTIINAEDYGRVIHDLHLRRQLIELGEEMVNIAHAQDLDLPATGQIETAEEQLFRLSETGDIESGLRPLTDAMTGAVRMAEAAVNREGHVTGVTTGLIDLDKKLGGLQPSDLVILAGRPSMGKTALATNIAFNAAHAHMESPDNGARVAFFSLEMSAEQLATRILAERTEISSDRIRRGEISRDDDFTRLVAAAQELQSLPLYIDDTPGISIAALRTRCRRLKRRHGLGLIVIDYLQLMRLPAGIKSESRVQEVSEITRGLKAIAKELNLPVLALAQLSRAVEQREDKRPQLSDLRESGSIEQDSDVVMFIYRDQYYLERSEPKQREDEASDRFAKRHDDWVQRCEAAHNKAEVNIAKQRHGPIGTVDLRFEGVLTKFDNLVRDDRLSDG